VDDYPLHRAEASAINRSPFVLLRMKLAVVPIWQMHIWPVSPSDTLGFPWGTRSTNMAVQSRYMVRWQLVPQSQTDGDV
jgi:hypothetical protein